MVAMFECRVTSAVCTRRIAPVCAACLYAHRALNSETPVLFPVNRAVFQALLTRQAEMVLAADTKRNRTKVWICKYNPMRDYAGQHTVAPFSRRGPQPDSCCHSPITR